MINGVKCYIDDYGCQVVEVYRPSGGKTSYIEMNFSWLEQKQSKALRIKQEQDQKELEEIKKKILNTLSVWKTADLAKLSSETTKKPSVIRKALEALRDEGLIQERYSLNK